MSGHIDLLKNLFTLEQEELHDYLLETLTSFYQDENVIEDYGQFLFAKGDIDVLLVAHLDTVHKTKPTLDEVFYDQDKGIMWSPLGIGGDDRCGVYIILSILFAGYKPHIAFTWNEEIGCVGSRNMVTVFNPKETMGAKINFAIQFDRRGHQESVYYDLHNPEFESYINSFGFNTKIGSFTDICEICPEWSCAGVNLSAGYANEHTANEMVFIATIQDTFIKACNILKDQSNNPQYFEYKELPRGGYGKDQGFWKGGYQSPYWDEDEDYFFQEPINKTKVDGRTCCVMCEQPKAWYLMHEGKDLQDVCKSCYNKYIDNNTTSIYGSYFEDGFVDDYDDEEDDNDLVFNQYNIRAKDVY